MKKINKAHTNHGVIAVWESRYKAMSVGLLGRINDLRICGLGLPKADVLHDGRSEQNRLLHRVESGSRGVTIINSFIIILGILGK